MRMLKLDTQKISDLKTSTLNVAKILCLQIPVFTTLHINSTMLDDINIIMWIIQVIITASSIFLTIWFFRNINIENKDKKWFRNIFAGNEWDNLYEADDFLMEIESFKKSK